MLLISIDLFAIAGTGLEYQLQLFAARTTCFLYALPPLIIYGGRRGSISIGRNKLSLLVKGAKNLGFSIKPNNKEKRCFKLAVQTLTIKVILLE